MNYHGFFFTPYDECGGMNDSCGSYKSLQEAKDALEEEMKKMDCVSQVQIAVVRKGVLRTIWFGDYFGPYNNRKLTWKRSED